LELHDVIDKVYGKRHGNIKQFKTDFNQFCAVSESTIGAWLGLTKHPRMTSVQKLDEFFSSKNAAVNFESWRKQFIAYQQSKGHKSAGSRCNG